LSYVKGANKGFGGFLKRILINYCSLFFQNSDLFEQYNIRHIRIIRQMILSQIVMFLGLSVIIRWWCHFLISFLEK